MKKKYISIFVACALCFSSCLTLPLRESSEVKDDGFSKAITVLSPEEIIPDMGLNKYLNRFFIRSFVSRSGELPSVHQIYIVRTYTGDWHFYNRAALQGGDELDFISINRDVDCGSYGCTYTEHIGINLPLEYLESNRAGFPIKVYSKHGHSFIVNISAAQIAEQLRAVEGLN